MVPEDSQKITSLNPAEILQSFGAENKCIPMSAIPQKKKKVTDKSKRSDW